METYYTGLETAINLVMEYIEEFCKNEPGYFETLELLISIAREKDLSI